MLHTAIGAVLVALAAGFAPAVLHEHVWGVLALQGGFFLAGFYGSFRLRRAYLDWHQWQPAAPESYARAAFLAGEYAALEQFRQALRRADRDYLTGGEYALFEAYAAGGAAGRHV